MAPKIAVISKKIPQIKRIAGMDANDHFRMIPTIFPKGMSISTIVTRLSTNYLLVNWLIEQKNYRGEIRN